MISIKRLGICLTMVLTLVLSPVIISNSDSVHASTQDNLAKIANAKKGKRASDFRGFRHGRWCSDFVWWSAKKAKLMNGKTFPKNRVGGTNDIQRYYTKKGQYNRATYKFKPQKGDLAIFGSSTHIGIVTKVKGNSVWVTHGNWSGKVAITKIKKRGYDRRAHARIKGYVRLDYFASEPNITVNYDANGGYVDAEPKKIKNTTEIGELPVPTKENATFVGWFTEDGEEVTPEYKVDARKEFTIYADYE